MKNLVLSDKYCRWPSPEKKRGIYYHKTSNRKPFRTDRYRWKNNWRHLPHAKDLKKVEEKFTISIQEPLTTEEKPTVRTQELTGEASPGTTTQVRRPGRPRKIKRGKVRKTALALKQPGNHEGTNNTTNNTNLNKNEYKPFYTYQTRSKTSNQVDKRPEKKIENSVIRDQKIEEKWLSKGLKKMLRKDSAADRVKLM